MILVIGKSGQLARALQNSLSLITRDVKFIGRDELDLSIPENVAPVLEAHKPRILINAAAYTSVDFAEDEIKTSEAINALSPIEMAKWCNASRCNFLHISTDYVFDGLKVTGYVETDATGPINAYGASKRLGEQGILEAFPKALILRCSWLHSPFGSNFVRTILRLAQLQESLKIIHDQRGSPTSAQDLADLIATCLPMTASGVMYGIYHACNTGSASWAEFAEEIFDQAVELGMIDQQKVITRITSSEYPQRAKRPANTIMATTKLTSLGLGLPGWRMGLRRTLINLKSAEVFSS